MIIGIESSKPVVVSGFAKPFRINSHSQRAEGLVTTSGPQKEELEGARGTPEQEQKWEEAPWQ